MALGFMGGGGACAGGAGAGVAAGVVALGAGGGGEGTCCVDHILITSDSQGIEASKLPSDVRPVHRLLGQRVFVVSIGV